ncbi:MAG: phosphatase PAP2 family protein [Caldimonas sp.]
MALAVASPDARADGGPFGIDHRVTVQDNGLWKRRNQLLLAEVVPVAIAAGALWEGDGNRLGHTFWQSVDSVVIGAGTSEGLKRIFGRARPSQTDDPNQWFKGSRFKSFPSGEVMEVTTAVTPFVLEYGAEHPAVYALELLPVYDAFARVKAGAHWQSDVLASLLIGTGIGAYAHGRANALSVGLLPHGLTVGWKKSF